MLGAPLFPSEKLRGKTALGRLSKCFTISALSVNGIETPIFLATFGFRAESVGIALVVFMLFAHAASKITVNIIKASFRNMVKDSYNVVQIG